LMAASREALRMGEIIEGMLVATLDSLTAGSPAITARLEADEIRLDALNESVKTYLIKLMGDELGAEETRRAVDVITYTTNLEQVGDIIVKNLLELAHKRARRQLRFSEQGIRDLRQLHSLIMDTLSQSISVFMTGDPDSAREMILRKTEFRDLELEAAERHIDRLRAGKFDSMLTSSIHLDVIRDFKRINSHLTSVAYPVLERAGELRQSRLTKNALKNVQVVAGGEHEPE
ncbi:MAG: PhoU domain-containing protein, partial [Cucumibacter sp.]